jgi:hypothetical protein
VLRLRHLALLLVDEGLDDMPTFSWSDEAPNGPLAFLDNGMGDHYFARFIVGLGLPWAQGVFAETASAEDLLRRAGALGLPVAAG